MAERLIRIAAERALRKGAVLTPPDHHAWEEFCARFPYAETDDQLDRDRRRARRHGVRASRWTGWSAATSASARPRWRCAPPTSRRCPGMQVAVIAPTTLLARQHFKNFAERFRGLPIRVRQLSRFVSAEGGGGDARRARRRHDRDRHRHPRAAREEREVQATSGCSSSTRSSTSGSAHKERLKALRSDVHVLTLTATPIPRTLQLALSGVRELSLIATPPVDRLAIRTYVSEFDPVTVREALLREHYRGGQAFYVVPRIADLDEVEAFLREQVPEVKLRRRPRPDGGERARRADERLLRRRASTCCVSTTIVESGLDIPAANTLIVERADMFGLAQLYQIRGRVGRVEAPRLRLLHDRAAEEAHAAGGEAAARARRARQPRGRVHAGEPGPRHPRRRQPARRGAVGPGARGRVRALPGDARRRRSPSCSSGDIETRRRRASGRRRSTSACRC